MIETCRLKNVVIFCKKLIYPIQAIALNNMTQKSTLVAKLIVN